VVVSRLTTGISILKTGWPKIIRIRNSVYYKLIERSDSTHPKSLRGVGPSGPYGPEAAV